MSGVLVWTKDGWRIYCRKIWAVDLNRGACPGWDEETGLCRSIEIMARPCIPPGIYKCLCG